MKTLLFSDTHLSSIFDPDKFYYLEDIISRADRVIINGDFWDRWFVTFNEFVNSQWQLLFPLLKEKKTVYMEQWGPESAPVAEWGTTWPSPGKIFQQSSAAQAMRTFFDFKPSNNSPAIGGPKEHDV